jgi:hypothetical protein
MSYLKALPTLDGKFPPESPDPAGRAVPSGSSVILAGNTVSGPERPHKVQ